MTIGRIAGGTGTLASQQTAGTGQTQDKTDGTRQGGTHPLAANPAAAQLTTKALAPRTSAARLPGFRPPTSTPNPAAGSSNSTVGGLLAAYAEEPFGSAKAVARKGWQALQEQFRASCAKVPPLL